MSDHIVKIIHGIVQPYHIYVVKSHLAEKTEGNDCMDYSTEDNGRSEMT